MARSEMLPEQAADLPAARQQCKGDWTPVQRIIQAAKELLCLGNERLRGLLQRSNALLAPLADPLLIDFGTHRQLKQAREEVYSDWLMWIVAQLDTLDTPERVFHLFGIDDPAGIALCQQTRLTVDREVSVPQGHDNQSGKLDLVVRYAGKALIVVEVKMTDADTADTDKHRGYMQWVKEQHEPQRHTILLAVEAAKENYHGFAPWRWDSLCVELRKIARTLCQEPQRIVLAAMILAFVGAVEQNVLSFPTPLIYCIYSGQDVKVPSEIGGHIEKSFQEDEVYGNAGHC